MDHLKKIKLSGKELSKIPLHFRKIYFNQVTDIKDEEYMFKYNSHLQCNFMRHYFPSRPISKTIDFKTFKDE